MKTLLAILLVTCALLTGCGTPKLYFEASVGYKINADYWLQPEHAGGRNPTAHFELGYEWENKTRCGINHWSHWRDGGPFNNKPETYKEELICTHKWGGY